MSLHGEGIESRHYGCAGQGTQEDSYLRLQTGWLDFSSPH
jgi:hypothetical protein